jgi:hypothetical protein
MRWLYFFFTLGYMTNPPILSWMPTLSSYRKRNIDYRSLEIFSNIETIRTSYRRNRIDKVPQRRSVSPDGGNATDSSNFMSSLLSFALLDRAFSIERYRGFQRKMSSSQVSRILTELSNEDISNLVWCWGLLYKRYVRHLTTNETQPVDNLYLCVNSINQIHQNSQQSLNARSTSKFLYGTARMGICWDSLTANASLSLSRLLQRAIPSLNSQGVANVLYALGKMKMRIEGDGIAKENGVLLRALLAQLLAVSSSRSFQSQSISNSLWGLYNLGLQWNQ